MATGARRIAGERAKASHAIFLSSKVTGTPLAECEDILTGLGLGIGLGVGGGLGGGGGGGEGGGGGGHNDKAVGSHSLPRIDGHVRK